MVLHGTLTVNLRDDANKKFLKWGLLDNDRKYLTFAVSFRVPFPGRSPNVLLSATSLRSILLDATLTYSVEARAITQTGYEVLLGIDTEVLTEIQISWLAVNSTWSSDFPPQALGESPLKLPRSFDKSVTRFAGLPAAHVPLPQA